MAPLMLNLGIRHVWSLSLPDSFALCIHLMASCLDITFSLHGLDNRTKNALPLPESRPAISLVFQLGEKIRIYIVHTSRFVTLDASCVIKR